MMPAQDYGPRLAPGALHQPNKAKERNAAEKTDIIYMVNSLRHVHVMHYAVPVRLVI